MVYICKLLNGKINQVIYDVTAGAWEKKFSCRIP